MTIERAPAECWLTDMDGVLVHEGNALPGAADFLARLVERRRRFLVLTNNSIFTPRDLAARLARSGLHVPEESIWTSALATADFLSTQLPVGSAYVIGEAGLTTALHEVGYTLTDTDPDYVVLGETRTYSFEAITRAIRLVGAVVVVLVLVVGRGVHVREGRRPARRPADEVVGSSAAEGEHGQTGNRRQVGGEPCVAERDRAAGQVRQLLQLPAAQQRHGGDGDAAGLEHREPAGHQLRVVRRPQQHPPAGYQPDVLDEHVRDLVGPREQLAVGPGSGVGAQAGAVGPVLPDDVVEECSGAVQPLGIAQLGEVEDQLGPRAGRRQVVPAERVDMCRRRQLHGGPPSSDAGASLLFS